MVNAVDIRPETSADLEAIREVNRWAFGQDLEGQIVDALRAHGAAQLSLVAVDRNRVVGHILYSPVRLGDLAGAALGPMAVVPEFQRRGIGSRLVEAGNAILAQSGCPFIVVLGHPTFYPRFGFTPAPAAGISCEWDVAPDVFMVLVLDAPRMAGATGTVTYRSEFGDPFDLARFVAAQAGAYDRALAELGAGEKRSHWMWFVFPQCAGLGHSPMAQRYAIRSRAEAAAFLHHPVLGQRLRECCAALLAHTGLSAHDILGSPDDLKLCSSATLFALVAPHDVFDEVLRQYYGGEPDRQTVQLLQGETIED